MTDREERDGFGKLIRGTRISIDPEAFNNYSDPIARLAEAANRHEERLVMTDEVVTLLAKTVALLSERIDGLAASIPDTRLID